MAAKARNWGLTSSISSKKQRADWKWHKPLNSLGPPPVTYVLQQGCTSWRPQQQWGPSAQMIEPMGPFPTQITVTTTSKEHLKAEIVLQRKMKSKIKSIPWIQHAIASWKWKGLTIQEKVAFVTQQWETEFLPAWRNLEVGSSSESF